MNLLFLGMLVLSGPHQFPQNKKADTIDVTVEYHVSFTKIFIFHGILSSALGSAIQFFGIAPKTLTYTETDVENGGISDGFSMGAGEKVGEDWLYVNSNVFQTSFVDRSKIPGGSKKKDTLGADAISFILSIRRYFRRGDSARFTGTFRVGKDTITFFVSPDTAAVDSDGFRTYNLKSQNQKKVRYMKAEITVGLKDGVLVYPHVRMSLYGNNLGLALESKRVQIEKKTGTFP